MKQTAVYFLYRFFNDNPEATTLEGYEVYKQAEELFEQQIKDAVNSQRQLGWDEKGEQYYNKTYKQ